jgi:CheY-like chemotaxis protein/Tfp pilus assembly protein PilZ
LLSPGIAWENVRVLVAESSELSRRHFQACFDRLGICCEIAADWAAACQIIERQGAFDLYFVDRHTPGIDAAALTKWAKSRGERGAVIWTASAEWENLQEAAPDPGADRCLIKPILSPALADCMNECLGYPRENYIGGSAGECEGKTLLLAEDIAINREIVLALLEDTGIHIDCAADGREALDMISRDPEKYDIVLMDIQMPYIDGLEATRRIRAMPEVWCKEIPVIAMTANVFKDDVESCLDAGMNAHIGKPIDVDDMMEKLGKFLSNPGTKRNGIHPGRPTPVTGNSAETVKLTEGTEISVDIRIFDKQGNRGVLALPSIITEVCPDGFFIIHTPNHQGACYALPRDEMFLIYFKAKSPNSGRLELFVMPARFVESVKRGKGVFSKLEPLGAIERSRRRASYRLPLTLSVSLLTSGKEGTIDAKMINFSDGGMLIATDERLEIGESITLNFSIGESETVQGAVLRVENTGNQKCPFETAIEFKSADREQKERFHRFITQKQMEKKWRQSSPR